MVNVELVTGQLHSDITEKNHLDRLRPAFADVTLEHKPCMEGTREDILEEVDNWIHDPGASQILWISGYPGTGKSAIAMSIAEILRERNRLGSAFFFERDNAKQKSTSALWRQVVFDLSQRLPKYGKMVVEKLATGQVDPSKSTANQVFRHLIELPLMDKSLRGATEMFSPVVVVDALDECGGLEMFRSEDRKDLLSHLCHWPAFGVKIIVTSREEDDILRNLCFQTITTPCPSLAKRNWPGPDKICDLTERASGLFIWASTVIRVIENGDPVEELEALDQVGGSVHDLYGQILAAAFKAKPSINVIYNFKSVCGALILVKKPLQFKDIVQLLDIQLSTLEYIRNGLRPVLDNDGNFMRFSHQSFVDYLRHPSCSDSFSFDTHLQRNRLASATLTVLRQNLRFNVCEFPSSYMMNDEVEDLPKRLQAAGVTEAVQYGCSYWAAHVMDLPCSPDMLSNVEEIFDKHFLHWLELLSLLGMINIASTSILLLTDWIEGKANLTQKLKDARRFLSAFGALISQSAPQIYLTALPFSPEKSWTKLNFIGGFLKVLSVESGLDLIWPAEEACIEWHARWVNSVAFSPDGRRIVSGSNDCRVCVWNAETGGMVSGPFEGHEQPVNSVRFSHDGRKVVFGSNEGTIQIWDVELGTPVATTGLERHVTVKSVAFCWDNRRVAFTSSDPLVYIWDFVTNELVSKQMEEFSNLGCSNIFSRDKRMVIIGSDDSTFCIWDAETGRLESGPFVGHTDLVASVAISWDGKKVVSGSEDCTVLIWDAEKSQLASRLVNGHTQTVTSVAISPNDKLVASGSDDHTILVWDANNGRLVAGPFEEHPSYISSLDFSPDCTRVVSGSGDNRIRIWNLEIPSLQPDVVTASFQPYVSAGHRSVILSVSFSHDGKRVASGSGDYTICIWDADSGELVLGPLLGHSDTVNSVAFSHDNKKIASGSSDRSVRLWDTDTGERTSKPFRGHLGSVFCVAFSPDGERIASGSADGTIRVWDARTGLIELEPFTGHTDLVRSLAFSHDNSKIVSGSYDNALRICQWDSKTGELLFSLTEGHSSPNWISSVTFSHGGKKVASASQDGTICIWDAQSGRLISAPFSGHDGAVNSIAFSSDSKRLVSGSEDRTVRIWDVDSGKIICEPLLGHTLWVNSVMFSSDDKSVVSGSADRALRIWNTEADHSKPTRSSLAQGGVQGVDSGGSGDEERAYSKYHMDGPQVALEFSPHPEHHLLLDPDSFSPADKVSLNIQNGWIETSSGKRMFWVPERYRARLWTRGTQQIMMSKKPVILDLSKFVHGPDWYKCYSS